MRIIHVGVAGPKGGEHTGFVIPQPGRVLAAIPGKPDHVLFEYGRSLFDVDISGVDAFNRCC